MSALQAGQSTDGYVLCSLRAKTETLMSVDVDLPAPPVRQAIRRKLLNWYDRNKRDLPWRRRTGDGYAAWVSEIMLQQTQVDTVIPYFERFMKRFPTVKALANATDDELLAHWQGLGYYRRAMNLHKAAKLVAGNGGSFPDTVDALLELPGIGRYTAGAVASIAFDRRAAAVDGNVMRVFARLFEIADDIGQPRTQRRFWALAEGLLPRKRCGDFNQAIMDLGATVCTPTGPRCLLCPLRDHCGAFASGDPARLPVKKRAKAVSEVRHVVAMIRRGDAFLMRKRPAGGLWSGLWEFPNAELSDGESDAAVLSRVLEQCGVEPDAESRHVGCVTHRLTHRLMHFDLYETNTDSSHLSDPAFNHTWYHERASKKVGISKASRKMLAIVRS